MQLEAISSRPIAGYLGEESSSPQNNPKLEGTEAAKPLPQAQPRFWAPSCSSLG